MLISCPVVDSIEDGEAGESEPGDSVGEIVSIHRVPNSFELVRSDLASFFTIFS